MTLRQGAARAFRVVLGTLLPIGGAAVAVYLVYQGRREEYLVARDHRAITSVRNQIKERIEAVATVIATEHRTHWKGCVAPEGVSDDCAQKQLKDARLVEAATLSLPPATAAGTRLGIVATPESIFAYVSYSVGCDASIVDRPSEGDCTKPTTTCETKAEKSPFRTCSRIPLDPLIRPLLVDGTLFDALALTVGSVPVTLRSSLPADLREDLQRALDAGSADTTDEDDRRRSTDEDVAKAQRVLERDRPKVSLQGEPFYVFSAAIVPGVASESDAAAEAQTAGDSAFRIHGLVRTSKLAAEARQMPNDWLLVLILLLVLAGVSWPLLKLWSMNPQERLNGLDVKILVLAMMLGAGVTTLALRQLAAQRKLVHRFDEQLGEVATAVEDRLTKDLGAARAVLVGPMEDGRVLDYADFTQVVRVDERAKAEGRWRPEFASGGWHLKKAETPEVTVSDRGYYADLRAERLWTLPSALGPGFAAEVVPSKTDGQHTLVLAMADLEAQTKARLIGMRVSALFEPVLPYGFGFAFVDDDGSVQLHSDSRRNLVENFIEECDGDARVSAAIVEASEDWTTVPLDVMYRGTPHRLVVHRVPGSAWRLAVFRDRRMLDRVNNEIIASWSALYLTYLGGFVLVLLAIQVVHDDYRATWLWPDRRHPALYVGAAMRLFATGVVAAEALPRQPGGARLLMLGALAAGLVASLCLTLGEPRDGVLSDAERGAARVTARTAGALAMIFALLARDWATVLAIVVLAAVWRPSGKLRPSQWMAIGVLLSSAALGQAGVPPRWYAVTILALAPLWIPRDRIPPGAKGWRSMRDRLWRRFRDAPGERGFEFKTENHFRVAYVGMLLVMVVVLGVVPAVMLHHDTGVEVITELGHFVARDLHRRAHEPRELGAQRLTAGTTAASAARAVYPVSPLRDAADADEPGALRALSPLVFPRMPNFGEPIPALRTLAMSRLARSSAKGAVAVATVNASLTRAADPPADGPSRKVPVPRSLSDFLERLSIGILWLALALVGFGLLWSIARLVFLLDIDRRDASGGRRAPTGSLIVWTLSAGGNPTLADVTTGSHHVVDLSVATADDVGKLAPEPATVQAARPETAPPTPEPPTFQIDHLENALGNPALHDAILKLLERLVRTERRAVVLTSEVDPLRYTSARVHEAESDLYSAAEPEARQKAVEAEKAASDLYTRWARLLGGFQRARWPVPPGEGMDERERAVAATLERKYGTLRVTPRTPSEDADEVLEPRHWQLWQQCTRAERLALRHLAEEGFLNPNAKDIVRPLFRRLLIRRDPAFSLPTDSFRRFVMRAEKADTVASWEQAGAPSAWSRLRAPLMAVLVLGAVYLLAAEPDAFNSSIALATGVAAGLPAILKLFSMMMDQKGGAGGM